MFLYAWDLLPASPAFEAAVERAPGPSLLFAAVLAECLERRSRYGLPRAYVAEEGEVGAIRGRIDFLHSIRTQAFERGRAHCRYEAYSADNPRNRIIRGALKRLLSDHQLWNTPASTGQLRNRLQRCDAAMIDIGVGPATRAAIRRERPGRNDAGDRLILAICELILESAIPPETAGLAHLFEGVRDARLLRTVFERFVARFLERCLSPFGWVVEAQKYFDWPVMHASRGMTEYLPRMQVDLLLSPPGGGRRIVVDTKFTDVLARGRTGAEIFKSAHLYQVYAYIQTQAGALGAPAEAILLYPAIRRSLREYMRLPGQILRLETIDLSEPWQEIEKALSNIVVRRVED
jgi:5-methylcytosine-specific restriction enzyme subunit McrC